MRVAVLAPLVVVLGVGAFVLTGLRGLDFGFHWDEGLHLQGVRNAIERGTGLPGIYYYPSVSHWLSMASMGPALVRARDEATEERLAAISTPAQRLATRGTFLVGSALAIPLLYAVGLAWHRRPGEAALAAVLLAGSWEYAYHARFVAPDGLVVTFALATLACALESLRRARAMPWVLAAAAAAGLATGSKWTAGLLVLPVALAAWRGRPEEDRVKRLAIAAAVFAGVYLLSTPGTLLEWDTFVRYLELQQNRYAHGHPGHTVEPGVGHALRIAGYLGLAFPSTLSVIALPVAGLACLGAVGVARERTAQGLLLALLPVLYLAYLAAYRVLIVRNLLVLGPFVCLLAARGAFLLWHWVQRPALRGLLVAAAAAAVIANGVVLVRAAERVRLGEAEETRRVAAWVDARPDVAVSLSVAAARRLGRPAGVDSQTGRIEKEAGDKAPDAVALFLASELGAALGDRIPGNDPGLAHEVLGPREVNFPYYATWAGRDRFLVRDLAGARELGHPFTASPR